jgi:hypothetical protein
MEDKRAVSTQEIVRAFSPASPQFLRPSTDGLHGEQEHGTKKGLAMRSDSLAGDFIVAKCLQNEIDYGLMSGTCTSSTSIARPRRQSS